MKKNRMKRLSLNRETLRTLDDSNLSAAGGYIVVGPVQPKPPKPITDPQTISICKYCTTPLDGCPDPTIV